MLTAFLFGLPNACFHTCTSNLRAYQKSSSRYRKIQDQPGQCHCVKISGTSKKSAMCRSSTHFPGQGPRNRNTKCWWERPERSRPRSSPRPRSTPPPALGRPLGRIAARPINNFVKDNDFTGKTVIPFRTSSSSGLGESGGLLADIAGTGNWQTGMRFASSVSEADEVAWVSGLGV